MPWDDLRRSEKRQVAAVAVGTVVMLWVTFAASGAPRAEPTVAPLNDETAELPSDTATSKSPPAPSPSSSSDDVGDEPLPTGLPAACDDALKRIAALQLQVHDLKLLRVEDFKRIERLTQRYEALLGQRKQQKEAEKPD